MKILQPILDIRFLIGNFLLFLLISQAQSSPTTSRISTTPIDVAPRSLSIPSEDSIQLHSYPVRSLANTDDPIKNLTAILYNIQTILANPIAVADLLFTYRAFLSSIASLAGLEPGKTLSLTFGALRFVITIPSAKQVAKRMMLVYRDILREILRELIDRAYKGFVGLFKVVAFVGYAISPLVICAITILTIGPQAAMRQRVNLIG